MLNRWMKSYCIVSALIGEQQQSNLNLSTGNDIVFLSRLNAYYIVVKNKIL
jgi:hypothetical protein